MSKTVTVGPAAVSRGQAHPLRLPPLGLGCAMLGRTDHGLDDGAAIDAIRHAAARGIAWFDTAPLYGAHLSEIRLGAALATIVPPPLVSTKIGFDFISPPGRVVAATARRSDYTAAFAVRSFAASCARLGRAHVELVFVHDPAGAAEAAATGTVAALEQLRADGRVGAIGVGVNDVGVARDLLARVRLDAVLLAGRYTLLDWSGASFLRECHDAGIATIVAAPLASGLLATGARSPGTYLYQPAPAGMLARVAALEAVCERHGVSLRAVALRFAAANPHATSLLVGAGSRAEIDDTLACLATHVPTALWDDLAAAGLLPAELARPVETPR